MHRKIGKALVVGGGISGIRSALDLAETGYGVTLIDRAPHLGGVLSQLDYQFPSNHCGMCKMLPLVDRDASAQFCLRKGLFHENIDILLGTEIAAIEGEPGNFTVALKERPTWVDPDRCIGCGVCEAVCPVDVPDAFNAGLSTRKAIYLPVPHTIPNPYVIDLSACVHCGECEKACPTDAVQLAGEQRRTFRILVVDDERIIRDSLKEWLEDEGFTVGTAESGQAALEKLGKETFHLMLTDIKMPGMDGVALLEAVKEMSPDLCVLMMTAYATVETAVEAMKIGALDYLVKPFDPETLIPMVVRVYEDLEASKFRKMTVGAIVLCGGTDYFNPADGRNEYGYGVNPNVVTSLAFERILSGTGPGSGALVRPHDGKKIEKIAWLQCVGSRDKQIDADFCSSICCMVAIKEAVLARERGGERFEAAIFYMDMRTFGKSFQRYRDSAESDKGVRFERARVHSVSSDATTDDPVIRYVRTDGTCVNERFDMVVLAVGQRPSPGTAEIAELADIALNPWGFVKPEPFAPVATGKQGIVVGGSFSGLKDISESVIYASAASVAASQTIHAAGGSLFEETGREPTYRDVTRENPRLLVAICSCGRRPSEQLDQDRLTRALERHPHVNQVVFLENTCTAAGWEQIVERASSYKPNRILIGACHPYLYIDKLKALGREIGLDPVLMEVVDIMTPLSADRSESEAKNEKEMSTTVVNQKITALNMGLNRLIHMDPIPVPQVPVVRRALVVGGGIAGMSAALSIADHGYPVDLVEKTDMLGGNLQWLKTTIDGDPTEPLLQEAVGKVEKHPNIDLHLQAGISGSYGEVGSFFTTIEDSDGTITTIEHGTVILATGGSEAVTGAYGFGRSEAIVTQKELESRMSKGDIDTERIRSVVMIQCVDSREAPRNYCSRVCCTASLKHALKLKTLDPDVAVYILYRDIMTCGFTETYFTEARQAGIIFIQYDVANKPQVAVMENRQGPVRVTAVDPILGISLEIEADLLVLATGIVPQLPLELANAFGAERDVDGFFKEAESKWRPVDALKDGVFACGLALSPRSLPESIATAGAAAQRSLRILSRDKLPAGKVVARVRESLCSLCERCIETCPYNARKMDLDQRKVLVNPALCQGCGACAAVCPNGASVVSGFSEQQMFGTIDAAMEGVWTAEKY